MFIKSIVRMWFNILLSVFLGVALCISGVPVTVTAETTAAALTKIQAFPDNPDYSGLVKSIDPKNLYDPIFKGMYEDQVVVNGKTRTFKTYIPNTVTQGDNSIYVAVPPGIDTVSFLEESGWIKIADKYKLYLFAFEPENRNWDITKEDDEIAYIKAVYDRIVNIRPYYNILMGNYYFVGYSAGGTLLQKYIMANPKICAGLAVFDGSDISQQYMKEIGTRISDDPYVSLAKVKVPVWTINESISGNTQNVIDYWRNANDCTNEVYWTQNALVYMQSLVRKTGSDNDQNVSKVLVSVRRADYTDARFNEAVWTDFLSKTCRYGTNVYNNALRPYASFEELGVKKVEMEVDGYTRHWFEYIPSTVKANSGQKVPLVVALHGAGQTGAIFTSYTEWYKVAEERGFIVVFPTGSLYAPQPAAAPRPGWNMTGDPAQTDDVKFIDEMVKNIKSRYAIDSSRVYISGQSMGSMMTNLLAMRLPNVFAAAASTSGPILGISKPEYKFPDGINTKYEIPVFIMFGEKDLFGGGSFKNDPDIKGTMAYWISRNKAGNVEEPLTYKSGIYNHQVWNNAKGIPLVRYSITKGRGHNCAAAEMWVLWDEFLCKFSRNSNGEVEYMQDSDVMK